MRVRFTLAVALLSTTFLTKSVYAGPVTYTVSSASTGITLGGTFKCSGYCPITITASGDTANVEPFSVTGARGLENRALTRVAFELYDSSTNTIATATFAPSAKIYFSVDQTNNGAGFGSLLSTPQGVPYGPTYPMGIYDTDVPVTSYDLASDIDTQGWSNFFPSGTAVNDAPPLPTSSGDLAIVATGPTRSRLRVMAVPVPAPFMGSVALLLFAVGVSRPVCGSSSRRRLC